MHSLILAKSAVLAAKHDPFSKAKQDVSIPEFDYTAAHTLVHYLYTEKYDDLGSSSQSPVLRYRVSTCVYCAAVRYELPGLVDLAKERVASLGNSLGISDVLKIAKDHAFPLLPDEESWYPTYLEDFVRSAMAKDPEPFRRSDFITQVEGNSRLLQIVWKTVMSSLAGASMAAKIQNDGASTPGPESSAMTAASIEETKFEVEDATAISTRPDLIHQPEPKLGAHKSSWEPHPSETMATPGLPAEDAFKLDDIEPTVDTNHGLESFSDELGFEKSKTYQKMNKKEPETESDLSSAGETRPEHKRSDSVMLAEEIVTKVNKEDDNSMEEVEKQAPVVVNDGIEANTMLKKNKSSKKKKKSSIVF